MVKRIKKSRYTYVVAPADQNPNGSASVFFDDMSGAVEYAKEVAMEEDIGFVVYEVRTVCRVTPPPVQDVKVVFEAEYKDA